MTRDEKSKKFHALRAFMAGFRDAMTVMRFDDDPEREDYARGYRRGREVHLIEAAAEAERLGYDAKMSELVP